MHSWRLIPRLAALCLGMMLAMSGFMFVGAHDGTDTQAEPAGASTSPAAPQKSADSEPTPQPDKVVGPQHNSAVVRSLQTAVPAVAKTAPGQGKTKLVAELPHTTTKNFGMVGVTWSEATKETDVAVTLRTRSNGTWSAWEKLDLDDMSAGGRPGTEPIWVGQADGVAVRVATASGVKPDDIKVMTIDPGTSPTDGNLVGTTQASTAATSTDVTAAMYSPAGSLDGVARTTPTADTEGDTESDTDAGIDAGIDTGIDTARGLTPEPTIISRSAWGAKPPTPCDSPRTVDKSKGAVVHHTAGSNSYTKAESAAIVRGDQAYHMDGHGWCDLGYNFIIDNYGQIFEGRAGGVTKQVRAAHSGNNEVNTYAMGVALAGTFTSVEPPEIMKDALVRLIGWRFAQMGISAKGTYYVGETLPSAARTGPHTMNNIAGHRNVVGTECPGQLAYEWIGAKGGLRDRVEVYLATGFSGAIPASVEGLKVAGVTSTTAKISWDRVPTAVKYRVYVTTSPSMPGTCEPHCQVIAPASLSAPSYEISGLAWDKPTYVKVSAINSAGKSITGWQSTPLEFQVSELIPATVQGLKASGLTPTDATVSWTRVPTAVEYRVYWSTSSSMPSKCEPTCAVITPSSLTNPAQTLAQIIGSVTPSATYYLKVSALDANGKTLTGWQPTALRVNLPAATIPATVQGLKASGITVSGATVSWTQVPTAAKYRVYWSTSSSMPSKCEPRCAVITPSSLTSPSRTLAQIVGSVTPGGTYYVKVSALNAKGQAITGWQPTPLKVALSKTSTTIPATVQGLRASGITVSGATVSWTQVPTAAKYRVYWSTSSSMPSKCEPHCAVITPSSLSSPSYALSGLTSGGTYYVKVSALNAAGQTITGWQPTPLKVALSKATTVSETFTVPSNRTVPITGHGYGHGIGMGQYGAQGAALQGLKYDKILATYYPGTALGSKSGNIRVLISADTTDSVMVEGASGLKFRNLANNSVIALPQAIGGKNVIRWNILPTAGNTKQSTLQYRTSSTWVTYNNTTWTGEAQFEGPAILGLIMPNDATRKFRGALRSALPKSGATNRDTVNVLSIEDYTRGVVAAEMPSSWAAEALKAQSVAARTYGVRSLAPTRYYDICDTTSCQVYGGVAREAASTDSAINATKGKILTYSGAPAFTQFSSSSGGYTAAGSQPYLKAVSDPYDNWSGNANHTWTIKVAATKIETAHKSIGSLKSLKITKRSGNGDWGGRVSSITLTGSKGSVAISGDDARWDFGLKSNWFKLG